jgi:hypothetical protein
MKQRKKVFRDSAAGTTSHGGSASAPSKRSHKYSKLLVELNDQKQNREGTRSQNSSMGSDSSGSSLPQQRGEVSKNADREKSSSQKQRQQQQGPSKKSNKELTKELKSSMKQQQTKPAAPTKKEKKTITPIIPLQDDDVGTMTGLSVEVISGANANMSVATIPSILQRQAEQMLKVPSHKKKALPLSSGGREGENLASRRNLAAVTIDVPPPTPQAQKESSGKLRNDPEALAHPDPPKPAQIPAVKPENKERVTPPSPPVSPPSTVPSSPRKSPSPRKSMSPRKKPAPAPSPHPTTGSSPRKKENSPQKGQKVVVEDASAETPDGPTDPEIVDMVLNKLGKLNEGKQRDADGGEGEMMIDMVMKKLMVSVPVTPANNNDADSSSQKKKEKAAVDPALELPSLTPKSASDNKSKQSSKGRKENDENDRPPDDAPETSQDGAPGTESNQDRSLSVSRGGGPSESKSAKIYNKVKAKKEKNKKQGAGKGDAHLAPPLPPDTRSISSQSRSQATTSTGSGSRGPEELDYLESRLTNLIQASSNLQSKLSYQTDQQPMLSERDRKIMAETVNKLDQNLKNILELQNSPEKRSSPRRRKDLTSYDMPAPAPAPKQPSNTSGQSSSATQTDESPLTKLETSMSKLFSTIMAQMSPAKRQISSSPGHNAGGNPKREKQQRDTFFSKETERAIMKLDQDKSNDDDSTLFVVEIHNKIVAESLTNDNDLHSSMNDPHAYVQAPSVINLIEPSLQSSITNNFQLSMDKRQPSVFHGTSLQPTEHFSSSQQVTEPVQNQQKLHPERQQQPSLPQYQEKPELPQPQLSESLNTTLPKPQLQHGRGKREVAGQQHTQKDTDRDPTIIDLTNKSTIISSRPKGAMNTTAGTVTSSKIINLVGVDTESQLQQQLKKHLSPVQQQMQDKSPHPPPHIRQLQLSSLGRGGSDGTTFVDTGGNGKGTVTSQQGSKLGMIVNLETVYENDQNVETTPENQNGTEDDQEEIDGQCVAAAAAGAAAGAEASGDEVSEGPAFQLPDVPQEDQTKNDQTTEDVDTNYPSEFITSNNAVAESVIGPETRLRLPKEIITTPDQTTEDVDTNYPSEFITSNNAVAESVIGPETRLRLPKEIITTPAVNPIFAVLQSPIHTSYFSEQKKHQEHASDAAGGPPSMVVVTKNGESDADNCVKEPALLAELLTAGPIESSLSLMSRREPLSIKQPTVDETFRTPHGTQLPKEITAIRCETEEEDDEDSAQAESPLSPYKGAKPKTTLPREILALLEERQGIGPSETEEARALVPNEIIAMLDHAYGIASPQADSGPPRVIFGGVTSDSNMEIQGRIPASPVALPKDIIAMLEDYDRKTKASGQNHTSSNSMDSPAVTQNFPLSLPREILAMQIPEPSNAEFEVGATNPQASPSNDSGQHRLWYLKNQTRLAKPGLSVSAAPTGQSSLRMGVGGQPPRSPAKVITSGFSLVQSPSSPFKFDKSLKTDDQVQNDREMPRGAEGTNVDSRFRFDAEVVGNASSQDIQDESHLAHPPSLPSKVVVPSDGAKGAIPNKTLPPSKPLSSPLAHPPSLPSKVVVPSDGAKGASPNRALPASKSLSSPFPMQFRQRLSNSVKSTQKSVPDSMAPVAGKPAAAESKAVSSTIVATGSKAISSTVVAAGSKAASASSTNQYGLPQQSASALPKQIAINPHGHPPDSPSSKLPKQITVDQPNTGMETIAGLGSSSSRMKLIASPLLQSRAKKTMANKPKPDLPPPSPASTRRPISSISPRSEKVKKALSRWKQQRSARSSSIMDDDEDDDEEETEEARQPDAYEEVTSYFNEQN